MSQHDIRNGHKISDNVIVIHTTKELPKKVLYNSHPSLYKQSHTKKPNKKKSEPPA
jgi:hypothetical protein